MKSVRRQEAEREMGRTTVPERTTQAMAVAAPATTISIPAQVVAVPTERLKPSYDGDLYRHMRRAPS